jgi:hypothetical protein
VAHRSLRAVRESLRRRRSSDRLVSLDLIVEEPDGTELVRAGGVWDRRARCYVEPPKDFDHRPVRIRLVQAQLDLMRGLAAWVNDVRTGVRDRAVVAIAGGNPGSGKTFGIAGIFVHLVALEWPGDQQFVSNLNSDNRRECLEAMAYVGDERWTPGTEYHEISRVAKDVLWANGSRLTWISARNDKKLRQRGLPIRHVLLNEAQLQPETLYAVAQMAGRSLGGICTLAMNPPTSDAGNWSTRLWFGIKDGTVRGLAYQLDSAGNTFVDQDYIGAAGQAVRVAAPSLAAAEVDGIMQSAGLPAFPTFDSRPYNLLEPLAGGCLLEAPVFDWANITAQETSREFGGDVGADDVVGTDFQKTPGVIGNVARLYRTPGGGKPCKLCDPPEAKVSGGCKILYIDHQVAAQGVEMGFSQALVDAGFTGNGWTLDGRKGRKVLLIGDGTGDRQNSSHNRRLGPPSFHAMRADGWKIVPPMYHWKHGIPWNPDVHASLNQMHDLFALRHVLLGPKCRLGVNGFPSLVESCRNAKRTEKGKLLDEQNLQHGPDGVRYLGWKFLPRPKPPAPPKVDVVRTMAAFTGIRITES